MWTAALRSSPPRSCSVTPTRTEGVGQLSVRRRLPSTSSRRLSPSVALPCGRLRIRRQLDDHVGACSASWPSPCGPPFFALATTAPLLQRWFAATGHPARPDPYFLYAASNAGSLLGLLAYPFLVEPRFGLRRAGAPVVRRLRRLPAAAGRCALVLGAPPSRAPQATRTAPPPATWPARAAALGGARVRALEPDARRHDATCPPTSPPIPLLWVVPLALYLLTFIIAFSAGGCACRRGPPGSSCRVGVVAAGAAVVFADRTPLPAARAAPRRVLRSPPSSATAAARAGAAASQPPDRLLRCLALGGALGGVFNALLAPIAFDRLIEYPIVLVLACLVLPGWRVPRARRRLVVAVPLVVRRRRSSPLPTRFGVSEGLRLAVAGGVLCSAAVAGCASPDAFAAVLLALALPSLTGACDASTSERSFFGVSASWRTRAACAGCCTAPPCTARRATDPDLRRTPLTYYHAAGRWARSRARAARRRARRWSAWASAPRPAYGQPGDRWTFFEIDPAVVRPRPRPASSPTCATAPRRLRRRARRRPAERSSAAPPASSTCSSSTRSARTRSRCTC